MKKKSIGITSILVDTKVGQAIFDLIGRKCVKPEVSAGALRLHGAVEDLDTKSPAAEVAERVTALINAKGGDGLVTMKPLGSPPSGILIPVVGRYDDHEVSLIRAALKRISRGEFSVSEEMLSGAYAETSGITTIRASRYMDLNSRRRGDGSGVEVSSHTTMPLSGISALLCRISRYWPSFSAFRKPARIIGQVALYGFAVFGLFATVAMLTQQPRQMAPRQAALQDEEDWQARQAILAQQSYLATQGQGQAMQRTAQSGRIQQQPAVAPPREVEVVTGKADVPQHRFYVLSDPLCPYCREFEPVLEKVAARKGFEMHLFPTPLHDDARILVSQIACAKNRGRAWYEAITDGKVTGTVACPAGENAPLHAIDFFHSMGLEGTPTVINEAGLVHSGGFGSEEEMIKFLELR